MAVDVLSTTPAFSASPPKVVLDAFRPPYAVARGRFLTYQLPCAGQGQPIELHVITNWLDELRRLAPAK